MQMILKMSCNINGQLTDAIVTRSGESQVYSDIAVDDGATNQHVVQSFKITDLAAGGLLLISTGQAMTVKTNDSESPDDTFEIPAGGFVQVAALTADITDLYVTNGSADTATTLQLRGVMDITP